ncbi:MAG TPA: ABC transporter permease [Candidatus Dormibacteraeota bacterium]|jgi:peptide/nickel transport system permease protein|nr:ABC transporter permease [Candidatus Dormibacteraeota bacterium]
MASLPAGSVRPGRGFWRESWDELRSNRAGMASAAVLCLLVAIALAAPAVSAVVTHYGPTQQDLGHAFEGPSRLHWLGTDELGRDTLTRLVYGARVSLGVGFLTVAIALTVGAAVGLLSGYYVGLLDDVLMRVVDVVLSVPPVFLYILMSILFRPNAITLAVIIASIGWAGLARLVRSEVLSLRSRDFIVATRSLGARDARLILRHVLPNALPVMIVAASLGLGQVVLIEAALDFLGLGIQAPTPSWGDMLSNAQVYFVHSTWLVVLPGSLIFLTVLAANVLGNAVRDAFDPRLRRF